MRLREARGNVRAQLSKTLWVMKELSQLQSKGGQCIMFQSIDIAHDHSVRSDSLAWRKGVLGLALLGLALHFYLPHLLALHRHLHPLSIAIVINLFIAIGAMAATESSKSQSPEADATPIQYFPYCKYKLWCLV
eukprot:1326505-Rhodomonas_salina.1